MGRWQNFGSLHFPCSSLAARIIFFRHWLCHATANFRTRRSALWPLYLAQGSWCGTRGPTAAQGPLSSASTLHSPLPSNMAALTGRTSHLSHPSPKQSVFTFLTLIQHGGHLSPSPPPAPISRWLPSPLHCSSLSSSSLSHLSSGRLL